MFHQRKFYKIYQISRLVLDKYLDTKDINTDIFGKYIKKLKMSKSVGPDNFHPKFHAEISENIKTPFTKLFKKSLEQAKVPDP